MKESVVSTFDNATLSNNKTDIQSLISQQN